MLSIFSYKMYKHTHPPHTPSALHFHGEGAKLPASTIATCHLQLYIRPYTRHRSEVARACVFDATWISSLLRHTVSFGSGKTISCTASLRSTFKSSIRTTSSKLTDRHTFYMRCSVTLMFVFVSISLAVNIHSQFFCFVLWLSLPFGFSSRWMMASYYDYYLVQNELLTIFKLLGKVIQWYFQCF